MRLVIFCIMITVLSGCSKKFEVMLYNLRPSNVVEKIRKNPRVVLVLGGGGARAIAQIGVLEVFEENDIPIDLVVATSGGSIIGSLYADSGDVLTVKSIALDFTLDKVVRISLMDALDGAHSLKGGYDGSRGERFLEYTLKAKTFDQLTVPLVVVATDVLTGKTIGLKSGLIAPAVRASYSIPGLFSPVKMYDMMLVDGGVSAPLGVRLAREYNPDLVIAVDVGLKPDLKEPIVNMLQLVQRSAAITYQELNDTLASEADVVIEPNLGEVGIFDDKSNDASYAAGREAALKAMPKIRELLKKHGHTVKY